MAQIANKFLAQAPTHTLKGNSTGGTANVTDLTVSQVQTMLSIPTSSSPLSLAAGGTGISAGSANAAFNALSPMTTLGDTIYGGAAGIGTRLAIGTSNQVLTVIAGIPSWQTPAASGITQLTGDVTAGPGAGSQAATLVATTNATLTTLSALTTASALATVGTISSGTWAGTAIAIAHGGTGQVTAAAAYNALSPMTTTGDIEYESGTNIAARLPIGSAGQVLTVVGGVPAWAPTSDALTVTEDVHTLVTGDITNQYVDLLHAAQGSSASINSLSLNVVGGPEQQKTVDYTVSLTGGSGGVTRVTFAGDLATGGNAALVSGDILMIKYSY